LADYKDLVVASSAFYFVEAAFFSLSLVEN